MEKKFSFNEDSEKYDKYRPRYCSDLFDKIINYAELDDTKYAIEVGIGTGQATLSILNTRCKITAIEVGDNLAEYTQKKFSDFKNLSVVNLSFEEFEYTPESYDLVYSATAFHWIPDQVGYPKAYDMLKVGGTLALFWNRPSGGDGEVYEKIQKVYKEFLPDVKTRKYNPEQQIYDERKAVIEKYGFDELQFEIMHQTRTFTAEDYISLLDTYSDHSTLADDIRIPFYEKIMGVINDYGGKLTIYDTIDLYLAKRLK